MALFLKIAIQAAKAAGKIHKNYYGRALNVRFKSKNKLNLVTEVDTLCESTVLTILKKAFPTHNFWGEESGKGAGSSEYTWLVDPLDGTTNFAHAYPFFCCSVALVRRQSPPLTKGPFGFADTQGHFPVKAVGKGGIVVKPERLQPIVGVVYDALRDECFYAEKDRGAFLNGHRLKVSKTRDLAGSLLCTGFAYAVRETHYNLDNFRQFVLKAQGVRRDGSAAMNLSYVAAGRFDGFWERGIQAWDMAAGILMVQEAGGKVTDITGKPFNLLGENALASNGKIHNQIFQILKKGKDEKAWGLKHRKGS